MAADKIKVIMLQRVAWIWKQWEIIEVSHTQAKNYLIPKWLVKLITKEQEDQIEKKSRMQAKNTRDNIINRHNIAEMLHWKTLEMEAKWSWDKIFGWVQELDIISRIEKEFSVLLEKKNIVLPEWHHIKKAETYDIKLNLWSDTFTRITLVLKVGK